MVDSTDLVFRLSANASVFKRELAAAAAETKGRAAEIAGALDRVKTVAGAVFGAAIVTGLSGMVTKTVAAIDGFKDLSDATGASVGNISALDRITRETGGNFDSLATTLLKFNGVLTQTTDADSKAAGIFKAIGLNAAELRKMDPAEALVTTAQALENFADGGDKARAIQELFGKSVKDVAPLLKDLAEGGKLVATVTDEQAESVDRFAKSLARARADGEDLSREIAMEIIPVISEVMNAVKGSDVIAGAVRTALQTVVVFGSDVAFVLKGVGTEIGGIAAQIAAIARLDFKGFSAIGAAMKADAASARKELDAFQARVMKDGAGALQLPAAPATQAAVRAIDNQTGARAVDARPRLQWSDSSGGAAAAAAKQSNTDQEKLAEQGKKLAESLAAQSAGLSGDLLEKIGQLSAAYRGGAINLDQLNQAAQTLVAQQPYMREAAAAAEKDAQARADIYKRELQLSADQVQALQQGNEAARAEIELIGLSEEQQRSIIRAREDSVLVLKEEQLARMNSFDLETRAAEQLAEEIRLLKERRDLNNKRSDRKIDEERKRESAESAKTLENDLKGAFTAAFAATKNPIEAFGLSLASTVSQRLTASMAEALAKSIQEAAGQGVGSGLGSLVSSAGSWISSLFGFANGGVMTSRGPVALHSYANGGVANSPQLALFGEGRTPEAFVPLPDGRRIPVAMKGGGGATFNVSIDARGADAGVDLRLRALMPELRQQLLADVRAAAERGGTFARAVGRR